jgi:hypothetical protein
MQTATETKYCLRCNSPFAVSKDVPAESQGDLCPECDRRNDTSLLRLSGLASATNDVAGCPAALQDLQGILTKLGTPFQTPGWFSNQMHEQYREKSELVQSATYVANERSQLVASLQGLVTNLATMRKVELEGQVDTLQKRIQIIKLAKELKRLQESGTGVALPVETTQTRRAKLQERQEEATQFLAEVEKIFHSDRSPAERRIHIRLVIETYEAETADLPDEIRTFLEEDGR